MSKSSKDDTQLFFFLKNLRKLTCAIKRSQTPAELGKLNADRVAEHVKASGVGIDRPFSARIGNGAELQGPGPGAGKMVTREHQPVNVAPILDSSNGLSTVSFFLLRKFFGPIISNLHLYD